MKKSFTRIIKKYNVDKENIMKINTEKEIIIITEVNG